MSRSRMAPEDLTKITGMAYPIAIGICIPIAY